MAMMVVMVMMEEVTASGELVCFVKEIAGVESAISKATHITVVKAEATVVKTVTKPEVIATGVKLVGITTKARLGVTPRV
jgi:hypothetical protein